MIKKSLLYVFIILFSSNVCGTHKGVIIVVHGTWGLDSPWCRPGGDFFDELEHTAKKYNEVVVPYMWQGYLTHDCRYTAARGLVKLIHSYPSRMRISVVAHSHGGNVTILASQIMAKDPRNKHSIDNLYTMATPINHLHYAPDMSVVNHVFNFFSFADMVQPVMGIFGRTFPEHARIANIRLILNGKEPGHLEFCTALSARWLIQLDDLIANGINGFENFDYSKPAMLNVDSHGNPTYALDLQRNTLLDNDRFAMQQVLTHLLRKKRCTI